MAVNRTDELDTIAAKKIVTQEIANFENRKKGNMDDDHHESASHSGKITPPGSPPRQGSVKKLLDDIVGRKPNNDSSSDITVMTTESKTKNYNEFKNLPATKDQLAEWTKGMIGEAQQSSQGIQEYQQQSSQGLLKTNKKKFENYIYDMTREFSRIGLNPLCAYKKIGSTLEDVMGVLGNYIPGTHKYDSKLQRELINILSQKEKTRELALQFMSDIFDQKKKNEDLMKKYLEAFGEDFYIELKKLVKDRFRNIILECLDKLSPEYLYKLYLDLGGNPLGYVGPVGPAEGPVGPIDQNQERYTNVLGSRYKDAILEMLYNNDYIKLPKKNKDGTITIFINKDAPDNIADIIKDLFKDKYEDPPEDKNDERLWACYRKEIPRIPDDVLRTQVPYSELKKTVELKGGENVSEELKKIKTYFEEVAKKLGSTSGGLGSTSGGLGNTSGLGSHDYLFSKEMNKPLSFGYRKKYKKRSKRNNKKRSKKNNKKRSKKNNKKRSKKRTINKRSKKIK
jgi:hypothetical protein